MNAIATNIKQLRIEARLTIEELAEKVNVSSDKIKLWEKGKEEPSIEQLKLLCPVLRISLEDMLERDILAERNDAGRRMKKDKTRKNYNWYLGDKKKIAIYIAYLVVIPVVFATAYFLCKEIRDYFLAQELIEIPDSFYWTNVNLYFQAYYFTSFVAGVFIFIWGLIRFHYRFHWWHLFFLSAIFFAIEILGLIGVVPFYIYSIVQVFIKKGRNR